MHDLSKANKKLKDSKIPLKSPKENTKTVFIKNEKKLKSQFENTKTLSKQALDSLLSKSKNSQFIVGKFPDSSDYFNKNDNQQTESANENYDELELEELNYDYESSVHPINVGIDPNVLLTNLTKSKVVTNLTEKTHQEIWQKPGTPRNVHAEIIKPRYITLNWLEPFENSDEIVSYTIYYKATDIDAR